MLYCNGNTVSYYRDQLDYAGALSFQGLRNAHLCDWDNYDKAYLFQLRISRVNIAIAL